MLGSRERHSKSTVLWKHSPRDTDNVILLSLLLRVRYVLQVLFITVLTSSIDHPYILAFSLIMLHTDAFNKSNKRKMTKADYIKNTKLVGVPTEVLDVSTIYLGQ